MQKRLDAVKLDKQKAKYIAGLPEGAVVADGAILNVNAFAAIDRADEDEHTNIPEYPPT